MKPRYGVRLEPVPGFNASPLIVISLARHLADFIGAPGIRAKSGATNARFRAKGSVTLRFQRRKDRKAYLDLIARQGPDGLRYTRTIRTKS